MSRLNVFSVTRASKRKKYLWLVPDHGLELGFGAAGEYEAHAHRYFLDLIYSPAGLRISPDEPKAHLAIVPPRVAFGPTLTAEFFFIKLLTEPGPFAIPEKVVGPELSAYPSLPRPKQLTGPFALTLSHFDPRDRASHNIALEGSPEALQVSSTAGWNLTILP